MPVASAKVFLSLIVNYHMLYLGRTSLFTLMSTTSVFNLSLFSATHRCQIDSI